MKNKVAVIMGSSSDADIMRAAIVVLEQFGIEHEFAVVSAHRSPDWMFEYAKGAESKGIKVIIAGAGGAAHLPGMMAALTVMPVIGVPIKSSNSIGGIDSLLSIVQMPNDVPVATVAVNGAHNAGILAVQMLAMYDPELRKMLWDLKTKNKEKVIVQNESLIKQ